MGIRGIVLSILWLAAFPALIGTIYVKTCSIRQLLPCWAYGLLTEMAAAQVVLVPCIAARKSFTFAFAVWMSAAAIAAVCALFLLIKHKEPVSGGTLRIPVTGCTARVNGNTLRKTIRAVWLPFLAATVILVQCLMAAALQHTDADDARFVAEAVTALEEDSMYVISPISGEPMYKVDYMGDVKKDLTSPWVMFVAFLSKLCATPPAVLSHSILPFYLVLFCYVMYGRIGNLVFAHNPQKTAAFLLFLSVFFVFDYSSTHTAGTVMLFRIWQGKAFAAAGVVPLLFYLLLCCIQQQSTGQDTRRTLLCLVVASFAGSLVSGTGILLSLLLTAVFGVIAWIATGKLHHAAAVWSTALPALCYLVCQYAYLQIFVDPYYI